MLKKTLLIGCIFIFLLSFLLLFHLFFLRPEDYESYRGLLLQKSNSAIKTSLLEPLKQTRQTVQKDIFLSEETERLHMRIRSQSSELSLSFANHKPQVIENLKNLECWFQDKLVINDFGNKTQQMRYFTASEGTYIFPLHHFHAHKVDMSFYQCPGHTLPYYLPSDHIFLMGYASEVSFIVSEKNPSFTATHLKAKIFPDKASL